jgi:hypothetical protein
MESGKLRVNTELCMCMFVCAFRHGEWQAAREHRTICFA